MAQLVELTSPTFNHTQCGVVQHSLFEYNKTKMPATTEELLDMSRRELLDLSTRNRLLSIPVDSSSARIVAVHDEISEQVYRLLVAEKKAFSFLPREVAVSAAAETGESAGGDAEEDLLIDPVLSQPENENLEEDIDEATGLPKRHVDCRLQTSLFTEGLQRRLLDLYPDSRAMIEEAGVNILYLALGLPRILESPVFNDDIGSEGQPFRVLVEF